MLLDFQQGIISYPFSGTLQRFLVYNNNSVNIVTTDGRIDIAFAHGTKNYLLTEASNVVNAWTSIDYNVDAWLYWDIDTHTAIRTFGVTYIAPMFGTVVPPSPVEDQHWFNSASKTMMRYHSGHWLPVIRVFACKLHGATFSPMGTGARPYAGTQVALNAAVIDPAGVSTGRILVDDVGEPIRRLDGSFVTSEDEIFVNGSPVNTIRLEANILNATAVENIARYQVVKFSSFGKISLARYPDIQNTAIAMSMEDLNQGATGTLCMQGVITNPEWNWTKVGAPLWAHGTIAGLLVELDPHVQNAGVFNISKAPIARVLTPTSIFFDQGMGGKGDKGDQGSANVPLATETIYGLSRLSVAANDVSDPVVVGDNDIRNTNDRYPLPHNQAASTITTMPVGILTGANLQDDLTLINNGFVKRAGDTMTGPLTLSGDPSVPMHAATKHYVDTRTLDDLSDVVISNPVAENVLKFDGTKWINGVGQSAQLWEIGSRVDTTNGIPAEYAIGFSHTDGYHHIAYGSVDELRAATIHLATHRNAGYVSINILTAGGDIDTQYFSHDALENETIQDFVTFFNNTAEFAGRVEASLISYNGYACFALRALVAGESLNYVDMECLRQVNGVGPNEFTWNWQDVTINGLDYHLTPFYYVRAVNFPTDVTALANTYMTSRYYFDFTITNSSNVNVIHRISLTDNEAISFNTFGALVDWMSQKTQQFGIVTTVTDTPNGGILFTSTTDAISSISGYGTGGFWPFNYLGGGYSSIQPTDVITDKKGVPATSIVIDPLLTPAPHTPALKETFIPMHTRIDSDKPDIRAPFWLAAHCDVDHYNSTLFALGGIAVGQPGSANGFRNIDTVYVIGSYAHPTLPGFTIEVRELAGDIINAAGSLITTGGYAGRSFISTAASDTPYDTYGAGIGVGNSTGDVYALIGTDGVGGYYERQSSADVFCLSPDLKIVKWRKRFASGVTQNHNGDPWFIAPRKGICVNRVNNNIHIAIPTAKFVTQGDGNYTPSTYSMGVTVITLDSVGNELWSTLYHDPDNIITWTPNATAEIAIHEASGSIFVAFGLNVVKLSNTGSVVWSKRINGRSYNQTNIITGLTVDQVSGDIFISALQDQEQA